MIAVGAHSRRDDITDAIGGREAGREIAALDRLIESTEGADIAAATRKAQAATDAVWPQTTQQEGEEA